MDVEKLSSSYLASTGESEGVDQGDLLVFAGHNVAVQLVLFLSREVASGWGGVPGDMSVLERARPRRGKSVLAGSGNSGHHGDKQGDDGKGELHLEDLLLLSPGF